MREEEERGRWLPAGAVRMWWLSLEMHRYYSLANGYMTLSENELFDVCPMQTRLCFSRDPLFYCICVDIS